MIRKHYAWIVLLMFGLIAVFRSPTQVSAAPTYDPPAANATEAGTIGWVMRKGFTSVTSSGKIETMQNGTTMRLPWEHAREALSNVFSPITITLTIWKLEPDGKIAKQWGDTLSQEEDYGFLNFGVSGAFLFEPDAPGTYYIQFSSDDTWRTATEITTINVLPVTTNISVNVAPYVLPSDNYAYPATATVTPDNSPDPVDWYLQGADAGLISLASAKGRQNSFNVARSDGIEFSSSVSPFSATIRATSGDKEASAPVDILRLPAINASLASLTGNQITHQLPELEKFAAQFPTGTTWQYQWKQYETRNDSGVISVVGSGTNIANEEGLVSASGSSTALAPASTQLVVNKQSTLMKRSVRAFEAGTPLVLTLELTANIPGVGTKNFTTNYAAFSVIRGGGALELTHVPEDWHTQYSFSEIYNHVVKDNVDGGANNQLTVSDTRELFDYESKSRWYLSVSATPFSDGTNTLPFVVDLLLGENHSNPIRLGAESVKIATGAINHSEDPVNYDMPAHTRVTSQYEADDQIVAGTYSSTLNWNLTTDIKPEALN